MIRTSLAAFTERLAASVRDRGTLPPLTPSRIRIESVGAVTSALPLALTWQEQQFTTAVPAKSQVSSP